MSESQESLLNSATAENLQWSLIPNSNVNVATDDHLQHLGININDNLPKFKINAPGPAALASSIFQKNNLVTDETNDQSFVVLGHSSIESIREASFASYIDVQQKCASNNHTCSLPMMSPSETEANLKKVLEENMKLKETLKQNNVTVKQQLNTITIWQKEVMRVCDNHKQKFLETKELINRLKKENDDLRQKISKNQTQGIFESKNSIEETKNSVMTNSIAYTSIENIPAFPNITTESLEMTQQNIVQSTQENDFLRKISILSEELKKINHKYSETQQLLEELENRYSTDIDLISKDLQKAHKELDTLRHKSGSSNSLELQKFVSKCCQKDMELLYLKEIITSLQQQIQKLEESALSLSNLQIESSNDMNKETQKLKNNVEFYNHIITELVKSFSSQCAHYLKVQQCLKESIDVIQIFENANIFSTGLISADEIKDYKTKLCYYRRILIKERLHTIDEKKIIIKVQQMFQQILSDYNSVVYELELFKDENVKLTTMQTKIVEENSHKLSEMEKYLCDEKKMLENEKSSFLEEKLGVQLEKKSITEEKDKLEVERNWLILEKERLLEERVSLLEEKTSLDLQSKLYEVEEGTLQKEKKSLQKRCELLTNKIDNLVEQSRKNKEIISELRVHNIKLKENEELIAAYKIQTEEREKQFEEMRSAQRKLQEQLQTLSMENLQLRTENNSLEDYTENRPVHNSRYCSLCATFINSEEQHGHGICTPFD